jgi:hypothetical protein
MATAGATHLYHGLGEGDADLYGYGIGDQEVTAVQPGVGDTGFDIYRGFGGENDDLFTPRDRGASRVDNPDKGLPRIYQGFSGDPDLSW